jgi:hypothetical protein
MGQIHKRHNSALYASTRALCGWSLRALPPRISFEICHEQGIFWSFFRELIRLLCLRSHRVSKLILASNLLLPPPVFMRSNSIFHTLL